MDGSLCLDSRPGEGTDVCVSLPLDVEGKEATAARPESDQTTV